MNGRPKLREDDRTVHEADGREEQEDIEVRAERTWSTRPGLLSSAIQCIADWQQRVTASNKLYERSNQSHSSGKMPVHHSMCDAILATAINIKAGGAEGGGREERGGRERGRRGRGEDRGRSHTHNAGQHTCVGQIATEKEAGTHGRITSVCGSASEAASVQLFGDSLRVHRPTRHTLSCQEHPGTTPRQR